MSGTGRCWQSLNLIDGTMRKEIEQTVPNEFLISHLLSSGHARWRASCHCMSLHCGDYCTDRHRRYMCNLAGDIWS